MCLVKVRSVGQEIDLLRNYPKANRNVDGRLESKSEATRAIARQFGKDFFDGEREFGYGGFSYHPRFWTEVIPDIIAQYSLSSESRILDVGCAKGFFLYDLLAALPGVGIQGIDISDYAIENSIETVRPFLSVAGADSLPFAVNKPPRNVLPSTDFCAVTPSLVLAVEVVTSNPGPRDIDLSLVATSPVLLTI